MFPKDLAGSPELLLLEDMLHRSPEVCRSIGNCQVMKTQSQGHYKFQSVSTSKQIIDQRRPEAREILELGWLHGRRRLNTSTSSCGEDFRGDILCEEELDN